MRYFIVDAFTTEPFGGNPAGVVLIDNAGFPGEKLMQQIAAEFRYSETAFVKQNGHREFTVRYFTPTGEVDLCGHATIATFGALLREKIVGDGSLCINHTLAGDLKMKVDGNVMMQTAKPTVIDTPLDHHRLRQIMGATSAEPRDFTSRIVSTGLPDIIMPVGSVDQLNALRPDMDALAKFSRQMNVTGVHAFALGDDGHTAHVRNFAPSVGIPEESATGTANAALTHYLRCHGRLTPDAQCSFLQGEAMGRPSVVTTRIDPNGDIWVGGNSTIIARGQLML